MENRFESAADVLIAGGGPAGTSLAIRLAQAGFRVVLAEREKFPRHKLCGEFISPECLRHFEELDVSQAMFAAGGSRIAATVFYDRRGRSLSVPNEWFGGTGLGLSRAAMDKILLDRAREAGAEVLEEASVTGVSADGGRIRAVTVRKAGRETSEISAAFFVDATGRAAVLETLIGRTGNGGPRRPKPEFVAFKSHVRDARIDPGTCEVYAFEDGYGGVNYVEDGLANHCFLMRAGAVKERAGKADEIVRRVILKNERAFETIGNAERAGDWLSAAIGSFGTRRVRLSENAVAVGDSASFIDPFTGSGILMALESSKILSEIIESNFPDAETIASQYQFTHNRQFERRLALSGMLRRTAFSRLLPTAAIGILNVNNSLRRLIVRATRSSR